MGFVKTKEELDKFFGLGVRKFIGAKMMGLMFGADPEITARLLPPPLEQADMPGGLIFIAEYPDTNMGPGYREAALYLRCKYKGEAGSYCLSMPITDEARNYNGRDVFGLPKRMANIHIEKDGNTAYGWVERYGIRFVEIKAELTGTIPGLPPTGPTYTFKAMPRIDLQPGFDGPVFLAAQKTTLEPQEVEIGTAEITLREAKHDSWAELGDVQPMMAFFMITDNTMLPGKILTEVDPEPYIAHYYKFTDFSSGE
jgi:Acetoacetate decarboxylase (ADC)